MRWNSIGRHISAPLHSAALCRDPNPQAARRQRLGAGGRGLWQGRFLPADLSRAGLRVQPSLEVAQAQWLRLRAPRCLLYCTKCILAHPAPRSQVYKAVRHGAQPVAVKVLAVRALYSRHDAAPCWNTSSAAAMQMQAGHSPCYPHRSAHVLSHGMHSYRMHPWHAFPCRTLRSPPVRRLGTRGGTTLCGRLRCCGPAGIPTSWPSWWVDAPTGPRLSMAHVLLHCNAACWRW